MDYFEKDFHIKRQIAKQRLKLIMKNIAKYISDLDENPDNKELQTENKLQIIEASKDLYDMVLFYDKYILK